MKIAIVEKTVKSAIARLEAISQVGGGVNLKPGILWVREATVELQICNAADTVREEVTLR